MFGTVNPSHACGAGPSRSRGHGRPRRPNIYGLVSILETNADRHFLTLFWTVPLSTELQVILSIDSVILSDLSCHSERQRRI